MASPGVLKTVPMLVAALVARGAWAQPGAPAPNPGPVTPPPAPAPAGLPGSAAPMPSPSGDASVAPGEPAPKADPAYGDRPDRRVETPATSDMPGIRRGRDIVVRYRPDRSRQNITTLAVLAGTSVVFGAIGLYFHFDARSASDEVEARTFTGRAWTSERQDLYDQAERSSTIAGVMYGIGGAVLLTTAIMYMVTEPGQEEMVITPNSRRASALVAPTRGGALVGGTWSF